MDPSVWLRSYLSYVLSIPNSTISKDRKTARLNLAKYLLNLFICSLLEGRCLYLLSAVLGTPPIVLVLVVVLVLDFFGRGKHVDCQQRSKIENENEDDDEDDWKVPIPR